MTTSTTLTRPARILLADDLPLFRRAIATLIDEQEDLEVVGQADTGVEAVELAASLQPDIAVLDVEMPVMDGISAARRIRETLPHVRIVMLTVWEDDDHLLEAIRLGVHGYLLKDLRPDELYDMLRSVMRDETPVSPALVSRLLTALRETGRPTAVPQASDQSELSRRESPAPQRRRGDLGHPLRRCAPSPFRSTLHPRARHVVGRRTDRGQRVGWCVQQLDGLDPSPDR